MRDLARRFRPHLTYANVIATLTAFAVLAGGTAFAANQLAKNSVGKKQLKANAVTTAKIKKNAVTAAKIKAGAVDGTKVKDASLANVDLNAASLPFGRVVHEAHGTGSAEVGSITEPTVLSLDNASYTQEAGRDDTVVGSFDVSIAPTCGPTRVAVVFVFLDTDTSNLSGLSFDNVVGIGEYADEGTGAVSKQVSIGSLGPAGPLQPATARNHTISLLTSGQCKGGSGITVSNPVINVMGVKK